MDLAENSHKTMLAVGHRNSAGRTFPCSFCGREFRNPQALGGHMNVHRRERDLASQLVQLRNHEQLRDREEEEQAQLRILHHHHHLLPGDGEPTSITPPPQAQPDSASVITRTTNNMPHGDLHNCAGSSSSSSSPPSQASISFATSLGCSVSTLLRRDSVDLELRLGHTPDYM